VFAYLYPYILISYSNENTYIGLLELEPGTILFARPLCEDGIYLEKDDIAESWCLDGYALNLSTNKSSNNS